jgi:hypothetical protein
MGVSFSTTITKSGSINATGITVPAEVMSALSTSKKPSVKVSLNGYTYSSTVAVMSGAFMIPLSQAHREASGLNGGDQVEVTLELDLEPRTVEIPADLLSAMSAKEGAAKVFEALAFSKRKELVRQVNDAKTQETRDRRITGIVANLVEMLN